MCALSTISLLSFRPVAISHFAKHVTRMGADTDFKFSEEFEVRGVLLEWLASHCVGLAVRLFREWVLKALQRHR